MKAGMAGLCALAVAFGASACTGKRNQYPLAGPQLTAGVAEGCDGLLAVVDDRMDGYERQYVINRRMRDCLLLGKREPSPPVP